jgi:hypothetical protein
VGLSIVIGHKLSVRASLTQDNVLWQVDISLNTLLARLQRASRTARENHRLNTEIENLAEALRNAKRKRKPVEYASRGTPLDPVLEEIIGTYIVQASPTSIEKDSNSGAHWTAQRDFVRF